MVASQRWRVYIVGLSWELFNTPYVLFSACVDDLIPRCDTRRHNLSAGVTARSNLP
jgi:hypothetical protein